MSDAPTSSPAISVVIAVHNGLPYLESAVRSIMEQTFRDIEIIIVDDTSSDGTPALLERLAAEDARLHVITMEENSGPFVCANRGMAMARAPLIARMDGDDIARPDRLAVQKAYMDDHPEVALLGMSAVKIDPDGAEIGFENRAFTPAQMRWVARLSMPVIHPTIMVRKADVEADPPLVYPEGRVAEDYAFVSAAMAYGDTVSLAGIGLDYRVHGTSITLQQNPKQNSRGREVAEARQADTLPPRLRAKLVPLMDAFYDIEKPVDWVGLAAAFGALIAHDRRDPAMPDADWIRQRCVQMIEYFAERTNMLSDRKTHNRFRLAALFYAPRLLRLYMSRTRLGALLGGRGPAGGARQ